MTFFHIFKLIVDIMLLIIFHSDYMISIGSYTIPKLHLLFDLVFMCVYFLCVLGMRVIYLSQDSDK